MIKHVNFTGRRRIPRERVDIEVFDGQPRTFNATINLDGISLLPDAAVILEAMCAGSNVIERFECGTVGNLKPLESQPLREIEGENVFFALRVIDRSERFGRILGVAENIRPERAGKQTATGRRGILPIERTDLGEEVWKLDFRDHEVFLLVNKDIPGLVETVQSDPLFFAVVYPQIVRRVLAKAFDEDVDIEEEEDRWPIMWLRFGKNLHPARENPPTGTDRKEEADDWIEDVVEAFCNSHEMKSKYLVATLSGEGGES